MGKVIKVKVWGAYREAELRGMVGKAVHVRLIANRRQGLPDEQQVSIEAVREQDRAACLAVRREPQRYRVTIKEACRTRAGNGKVLSFKAGAIFHGTEQNLQQREGLLCHNTAKYGVLAFKLDNVTIEEMKKEEKTDE